MTSITSLPRSGHTAMPWRNGAGTTQEIAIAPTDDPAVPFRWRLSMADLAGDGPFSEFPGVDRVLLLLEGDGVTLTIDGAAPRPLPAGTAIAFPADVPTHLTMESTSGRDLNLMWDRRRVAGAMVVVAAGSAQRTDEIAFVVALTASVVEVDGERLALDTHDALRLDGAADLGVDEGAVALATLRAR